MFLISNLLTRVEDFNENLSSGVLLQNIIIDNEAFIVNMNAEEQLFDQGVNSLGVSIEDYAPYSPYTIEIKRQKGQPTNRVTLHDEGDFANSIFIDAGRDKFEIKAADSKTQSLIRKYGRQILGLTNENLKELIEKYILPEVIKESKKYLYGKQ